MCKWGTEQETHLEHLPLSRKYAEPSSWSTCVLDASNVTSIGPRPSLVAKEMASHTNTKGGYKASQQERVFVCRICHKTRSYTGQLLPQYEQFASKFQHCPQISTPTQPSIAKSPCFETSDPILLQKIEKACSCLYPCREGRSMTEQGAPSLPGPANPPVFFLPSFLSRSKSSRLHQPSFSEKYCVYLTR